jgi:hypothetical protein
MFDSCTFNTPLQPYPDSPSQDIFHTSAKADTEWDDFLSSRIRPWNTRPQSNARRNVGGTPKHKWTIEEDALLEQAVAQLGLENWRAVSANIAGRNSKQCRERWMGHHDPGLSRARWSAEEDLRLVTKQRELGNQWAEIKQFLPGRSILGVKNRWIWLSRREVPRHNAEFSLIVASHEAETIPVPSSVSEERESLIFTGFERFDLWEEGCLFGDFE